MQEGVIKLLIETGEKNYVHIVKLTSKFPCVIGRQSPDLTINSTKISRKHCQLVIEAGVLYIDDLGSRNGTDVNGSKIKRTRLRIDDKIIIGGVHIKILSVVIKASKPTKGGGMF
ncbi:MAG: FHA domain-containing protein [Pseudobdellovibrio sp.]